MQPERKWQILHDFRRQVRRGLAKPSVCPMDNEELVPKVGADDEPVLACLRCRSLYHIGLDEYDAMERQL